jgi:hypothetical protein
MQYFTTNIIQKQHTTEDYLYFLFSRIIISVEDNVNTVHTGTWNPKNIQTGGMKVPLLSLLIYTISSQFLRRQHCSSDRRFSCAIHACCRAI